MAYISTSDLTIQPQNISTQFRESFETYDTANVWSQSIGSGDIVQLDGNAVAASYLVISKDPLSTGTTTTVATQSAFVCPTELMIGLGFSQRILGQECAVEFVSTDTPLPPVADIAISSITQSTTTLTVTTSSAHGLSAGQRIGIYGVTSDSRFNYPSLVISTITSTTTFTCTSGPNGTIASVTAGPYTNQGFVYMRPAMSYAQEGFSQVFENTSSTNASYYVRSDAGDVYPSSTFNGSHSVTCGTVTSTVPISSPYTYSFVPSTEFRYIMQADRVQFYDAALDTSSQPTNRLARTQVVPNVNKAYKLRFRFTNNKSLTVPTAKIVSAAKSGSTTATITTDVAHGLTTGDYVILYGMRDTTNFAGQTTQLLVASTPTTTSFTVAFGTSVTATTYGGMVARAQGGNAPGSFTTVAAQTATVTATELILVGHTNWAFTIGDYVNAYGIRNATNGADMGVDGVYKIANQSTTTLTLIPISTTVLPAAFGATNVGGTVIKRSDIRISYVRLFEYLRERVEILNKSDSYGSVPVIPNGGTVSSITQAYLGSTNLVSDQTSAALTTTTTTSAITPGNGALSQEYNVIVTAVSGTNPTYDFVVQESDDSGTNWYDVYHFPRITASGQYRSPPMALTGNRVRYVQTLAGTSPSFTRSINRLQLNYGTPLQRQFINRTLDPNTLDSTTGSFFSDGCLDFNVFVSMGAVVTTAPVLVVEISPDNSSWVVVGTDITTAANTNNNLVIANTMGRFIRVRVKTQGSGATLNYIVIKGMGR